jgi:hypothetical protein
MVQLSWPKNKMAVKSFENRLICPVFDLYGYLKTGTEMSRIQMYLVFWCQIFRCPVFGSPMYLEAVNASRQRTIKWGSEYWISLVHIGIVNLN